jgi:hypothetical protein
LETGIMTQTTSDIRPRPEHLRELPTLATRTTDQCTALHRQLLEADGIDWVTELKLDSAEVRYWLCTRGLDHARPDWSEGCVVGYITPEYRRSDGTWVPGLAYGSAEVDRLQGMDYLHKLLRELRHLHDREKNDVSWALKKQIDATQDELYTVSRILGYKGIRG